MIEFTVLGTPRPQGSTRAFIPKGWTRAVITSDNKKLKPWRQQVSEEARATGLWKVDGPVLIRLAFFFKRPKSAPKSRLFPVVKPDLDKLIRAILDGLTGILYNDDAQVVNVCASKSYGEPERVDICIEEVLWTPSL